MGLYIYTASADTTITDAFDGAITTKNTGSNMGLADSLEVFSIFGQESGSAGRSVEKSRILIKFPVATMSADRDAKKIPASGSVSWFLKLYNTEHPLTLPSEYTLAVKAVSTAWDEGLGVDMESYTDRDEANWVSARSGSAAAATATVTVANEGWMQAGDNISLVSTNGTTVVCTITAIGGDTTDAAATTAVEAAIASNSSTGTATNIATAINYSSYFTATASGTEVTITQATTGYAGNTAITLTDLGGGTGLTKTDFTGGDGLVSWTTEGGDYHTTAATLYSQTFKEGYEDLDVDISELVEQWIAGTKSNYGVGVMMSGSYEDGTDKRSYYTKRFSARGTQYFFKRPTIEARWDKAKTDDRASFYLSSSMAPAADNLNTLYLYNYVRGQLKNIPAVGSTGSVLVSIYSGTTAPSGDKLGMPAGGNVVTANHLNVTGGDGSTGIYSASFAVTSSIASTEYLYDVWHSGSTQYFTGSAISLKTFAGSNLDPNPNYVINITNLKTEYSRDEKARFRIFTRLQNWNPTIYTKATATAETTNIEKLFYKIRRPFDDVTAIPYGTGSVEYTKLSYDTSGSYFDLSIDLLESGYLYEINFIHYTNGKYVKQPEIFRFKVK